MRVLGGALFVLSHVPGLSSSPPLRALCSPFPRQGSLVVQVTDSSDPVVEPETEPTGPRCRWSESRAGVAVCGLTLNVSGQEAGDPTTRIYSVAYTQ